MHHKQSPLMHAHLTKCQPMRRFSKGRIIIANKFILCLSHLMLPGPGNAYTADVIPIVMMATLDH